jgi:4-carboxymuconolactone decarboxylase
MRPGPFWPVERDQCLSEGHKMLGHEREFLRPHQRPPADIERRGAVEHVEFLRKTPCPVKFKRRTVLSEGDFRVSKRRGECMLSNDDAQFRQEAAQELHRRMIGPYPEPSGDEFDLLYDITCRVLWPEVWLSPGLDLKTRSLCTVAALTALGRPQVRNHISGALANGATRQEIAEVITHLAFYAGWPAVGLAVVAAREIFADMDDDGT